MIKPRTLQGFFDYFPQDMILRKHVENTIRQVFVSHGYDEINTPSIEYAEILFGKYGEDEKLIYNFNDHGDRHVALRYDQTVPLARFVAEHDRELTFPFKRFEIGRVWRADAARKARKREFIQCDVDIIGTDSIYSDAEILFVVSDVFKALKMNDCYIKLSNRKILISIFENQEFGADQITSILRSVDKFDKIGLQGVLDELQAKSQDQKLDFKKTTKIVKDLFSLNNKKFDDCIQTLSSYVEYNNIGVGSTKQLIKLLEQYGLSEGKDFQFDITLVRGLDYYTGMVFEVKNDDYKASFAGGGRYADLCSMYSKNQYSGVGVGIGFEPICVYLQEQNANFDQSSKILMTVFGEDLLEESIKIAKYLRETGFSIEIYPNPKDKFKKQFKYADKKGYKNVIVVGENEIKNGTVIFKNMASGEQQEITKENLVANLNNL